jgi:glycosyltransferase involved in cell wall biosynthesis
MIGTDLEFDIVIATRNRQSILPLSLQTMLSQTRLPRRLIVVDSSDNHSDVQQIVRHALYPVNTRVDLQIIRSATGSSYQRNVGLTYVQSSVVFFPDDDVLWFPGVADSVMRIYEKDTERTVGCVAPTSSRERPQNIIETTRPLHRMELRDRISLLTKPVVHPIEERLLPDPMHSAGMWLTMRGITRPPLWLHEEDAHLCGPVAGYQMSFRTEVIRKLGGFDENLGRYSLYEDSDASIGCLKNSINVCASRAKVFHYRVPGARASGAEFGMMAILNRTYITCKHSPQRSVVRHALSRFLHYQMTRYFLQTHSRYGRTRLRGALYGLSNAQQLMGAPREELLSKYLVIRSNFAER